MSGRVTRATTAVAQAGVWHALHEYNHKSSATSYGLEAAAALGVEPERVFKTLIISVEPGRLVTAIVPVITQVDLKAVAVVVGSKKALIADPVLAQRATGYVIGGISPLGQRQLLPTIIDQSALQHETIFVSAGRRGLEVELLPSDLVHLCRATTALIT